MLACMTVAAARRFVKHIKPRPFGRKQIKMSARSERRLLDDQDEMEYNITFPTPTGAEDVDAKEPVVYILGWAGSTDRILAKYSSIYEREGCITLRYTLPTDSMFILTPSSVDYLQGVSRKLLQLLDDYDLRENPVIFHTFSNAGAMLYRWTADLFLEEKVNVMGVVMDSCPSRLQLPVGIKAIYFVKRPLGLFTFLAYLGRFFFNAIKVLATFSWDTRFDVYEALKTSDNNLWPHLFLYSTNDGVIPPQHVTEIAKARKSAGATFVRTHDFVTSQHVHHFKEHREKYIDECVQFLDDCLKIYDGDEVEENIEGQRSRTSSVDPDQIRPQFHNEPSSSRRESSLRIRKSSQSETKI